MRQIKIIQHKCVSNIYLTIIYAYKDYVKEKLTRIALKTVELIPSATSYSPFSLGRVKLCSLPDPNILCKRNFDLFPQLTDLYLYAWIFNFYLSFSCYSYDD